MMEKENELIEQNLKCPICFSIVEDPWETTCCGQLFCQKCKDSYIDSKCPLCWNNKFKFRKNLFASLLLSKLQTKCPFGCEEMITFKKVKIHKYECKKYSFKCKINGCSFEGNKKEALQHLIKPHPDLLSIVSENYNSLKLTFEKFDIINGNEKENNKIFDILQNNIKGSSMSENRKTN